MALSYSKNFNITETALLIQEFPLIYPKSGDGPSFLRMARGITWSRGNFDPFFSGMLPDETAVFLFIINPSSIKLDGNTEWYVEFSIAKNFRCFKHYSWVEREFWPLKLHYREHLCCFLCFKWILVERILSKSLFRTK